MNFASTVAGGILLAAYTSLVLFVEPRAELGRALAYVGWEESLFWLAHFSLATPGLLFLGHGLAPRLDALVRHARRRFSSRPPSTWRLGAGIFCLALFTVAVVGRSQLLLHMPITDDEQAVAFGARMVAEGQLSVPAIEPREAFPLLFTLERNGLISSFDFPGGIFLAALSQITGIGSVLYAALAALSGLAVAYAGGCLAGRRGSVAAAGLWLLSPMVLSLSYTTHAQLVSRSFVALATAGYCRVWRRPAAQPALTGAWLGLAAGLAFLCRPIEAACLLGPMGVHLLFLTRKQGSLRKAVAAASLAWLACALVFAWYNHETTGAWYLQARFAPEVAMTPVAAGQAAALGIGTRLGLNLGFNLMMLFVWFLGPLGAGLVWLGLRARAPVVTVLGSGIGLQLLVALAHDDTGIHSVGPVHYSECAAALTLVATLGLARAWRKLAQLGIPRAVPLGLLAGFLVSQVLFNGVYSCTLHEQAKIQRIPHDAIERLGLHHAVVVADPPERLWEMRPEMASVRSWVKHFPPPDPFLRDDVVIVYPSVRPETLTARFPDRTFYRMTYNPAGDPVTVRRLRHDGGTDPSRHPLDR